MTDYDGLVGSALALRYLQQSAEPAKLPAGAMADLVRDIRSGALTLRATAARLPSWATNRIQNSMAWAAAPVTSGSGRIRSRAHAS